MSEDEECRGCADEDSKCHRDKCVSCCYCRRRLRYTEGEEILTSLLATVENIQRTIHAAQARAEIGDKISVREVYDLLRFDLAVFIKSLRALRKSSL